jgi:hypothetical protein
MALSASERWDSGFVRDLSGNLVIIDSSVAVGVTEQSGFLRDADGRLVVSSSGSSTSAAAKYRLVSDGTTVTAYDQSGASVSSGTDGGAVLSAVLPAANSAGYTIEFRNDGNVFPWSSVPALPKGITNKLLIRGNGVNVRLSASGPRFLDFNRTADHDVFQNIELTDFVIDDNNVGGLNHKIIGNWRAGTSQMRLNYSNIVIRRFKVLNVPTDPNTATHRARHVYLACTQAAAGEATQNYAKDITVEDIEMNGGEQGVAVIGNTIGGGVSGYNIFLDNITVRRFKHVQPAVIGRGARDGAVVWGSGVQVGSRAFGGRCRISEGYVYGSGDVAIEINAMRDALCEDVLAEECAGFAFFHTNYNFPDLNSPAGTIPATAVAGQSVIFRNCRFKRLVSEAYGSAFRASSQTGPVIPLGKWALEDCQYYRKTTATDQLAPPGEMVGWSCDADEVVVEGFHGEIEGINYTDAGAAALGGIIMQQTVGATKQMLVRLKKTFVRIAGVRGGGAGTLTVNAYLVSGGANGVVLDCDDIALRTNITNQASGTTRGFEVDATTITLSGTVRRFKVLEAVGDATFRATQFRGTASLTIPQQLIFEEADFRALASGQLETLFAVVPQNQDKITFVGTNWRVFPKPSAAMGTSNFAAATFTSTVGNQYVGGSPAEIHFATGTGAGITTIDVSKDGATYENVYTQASGAMAQSVLVPVDNGDFVKVTFATTQPTTRVRFRR